MVQWPTTHSIFGSRMHFANSSRSIFFQFFSFFFHFCGDRGQRRALIWPHGIRTPYVYTYLLCSPMNISRYRPMASVRFGIFRSLTRDWIRQRLTRRQQPETSSIYRQCLIHVCSRADISIAHTTHAHTLFVCRHNRKQIKMLKRMGWLTSERAAPDVQILNGHCLLPADIRLFGTHGKGDPTKNMKKKVSQIRAMRILFSVFCFVFSINVNFFGNNRMAKKIVKLLPWKSEAAGNRQAAAIAIATSINVNQR